MADSDFSGINLDSLAREPVNTSSDPFDGIDIGSLEMAEENSQPFMPTRSDPPEKFGAAMVDWIGPAPISDIQYLPGGDEYLDIVRRNREGRAGFVESLFNITREDTPFAGDVFAIKNIIDVTNTVRKLQNGDLPSDEELVNLNLYLARQERITNAKFSGNVGNLLRGQLKFWGEIAGTVAATSTLVGGGAAATTLIGKEAAEEAAKSALKTTLAKGLPKIVQRGLTGGKVLAATRKKVKDATLGAIEAQIEARIPNAIISKTASKMAARTAYTAANMGVHGSLMTMATGGQSARRYAAEKQLEAAIKGEDPVDAQRAMTQGVLDSIIQYGSEFVGADLMRDANRVVLRAMKKEVTEEALDQMAKGSIINLFKDDLGIDSLNVMSEFLENMGIGGVVEEMLEERVAGFYGGLLGTAGDKAGIANAIDQTFPSLRQLGTEAVAFAIPGVAVASTAASIRGSEYASKYKIFGGVSQSKSLQNKEDINGALEALQKRKENKDFVVAPEDILPQRAMDSIREESEATKNESPVAAGLRVLHERLFGAVAGSVDQMLKNQRGLDAVNQYRTVKEAVLRNNPEATEELADSIAMGSVQRSLARSYNLNARGAESAEEAAALNALTEGDNPVVIEFEISEGRKEWFINPEADLDSDAVEKLSKVGRLMNVVTADNFNLSTLRDAGEMNFIKDRSWESHTNEERQRIIDLLAARYENIDSQEPLYDDPHIVERVRQKYNGLKAILTGIQNQQSSQLSAGDIVIRKNKPNAKGAIVQSVSRDVDGSVSLKIEGVSDEVDAADYDRLDSSLKGRLMNSTAFIGTKEEIRKFFPGHEVDDHSVPVKRIPDNPEAERHVVFVNARNKPNGEVFYSIDADPISWIEDTIEGRLRYKNSFRENTDNKSIGSAGEKFIGQVMTLIDSKIQELSKSKVVDGTKTAPGAEALLQVKALEVMKSRLLNSDHKFELFVKLYVYNRLGARTLSERYAPKDIFPISIIEDSIPEEMWDPVDRMMEEEVGISMMNAIRQISDYEKPAHLTTAEESEVPVHHLADDFDMGEELPVESEEESPFIPKAEKTTKKKATKKKVAKKKTTKKKTAKIKKPSKAKAESAPPKTEGVMDLGDGVVIDFSVLDSAKDEYIDSHKEDETKTGTPIPESTEGSAEDGSESFSLSSRTPPVVTIRMHSSDVGNVNTGGFLSDIHDKIRSAEARTRDFLKVFDKATGVDGYGERLMYKYVHQVVLDEDVKYGPRLDNSNPTGWKKLTEAQISAVEKYLSDMREAGLGAQVDSVIETYKSFVIAPSIVHYRHLASNGQIVGPSIEHERTQRESTRYLDVAGNMQSRYMYRSMGVEKLLGSGWLFRVLQGSMPSRLTGKNNQNIRRARGRGISPASMTPEFVESINRKEYADAKKGNKKGFWITLGRFGEKESIYQVYYTGRKWGGPLQKAIDDYAKDYETYPDFVQRLMPDPKAMQKSAFKGKNAEAEWEYNANQILARLSIGEHMFGKPHSFSSTSDMIKRLNTIFTPGIPIKTKFRYVVYNDSKRNDGMAFFKEGSLGQKVSSQVGSLVLSPKKHHLLKMFGSYTDENGDFVSWKPLFFDIDQLAQYPEFREMAEFMGDDLILIPTSSLKVNGKKLLEEDSGTSIPILDLYDKEGKIRKRDSIEDLEGKYVRTFDSESEDGTGGMYLNQDMNYSSESRLLFALKQLDTIRLHLPKAHHDIMIELENQILRASYNKRNPRQVIEAALGTPVADEEDIRDHGDMFMLRGNLRADIEDPSDSITFAEAIAGMEGKNAFRALASQYSKIARMKFPKILRSVAMGVSENSRIKLRQNIRDTDRFAFPVIDTNMKNGRFEESVPVENGNVAEAISKAEAIVRLGGKEKYPWMFKMITKGRKKGQISDNFDQSAIRVSDDEKSVIIPGMPVFYARVPASGLPFMASANLGSRIGNEDASYVIGNPSDDLAKGQDADGDQAQIFMFSMDEDGNILLDKSVEGYRNRLLLMWFDAASQYSETMSKAMTQKADFDFLGTGESETSSWYTPEGQIWAMKVTSSGKAALEIFAAQAHTLRLMNHFGISFKPITLTLRSGKTLVIGRTKKDASAMKKNRDDQIRYDSYWINNSIQMLVDDIKNPKAAALGIDKFTAPYFVAMMSGAIHLKTDAERRDFGESIVDYVLHDPAFKKYIGHVRNGLSSKSALNKIKNMDGYVQLQNLVKLQESMFGLYNMWNMKYTLPGTVGKAISLFDRMDAAFGLDGVDDALKDGMFDPYFNRRRWLEDIIEEHPVSSPTFEQIRDLVEDVVSDNRGEYNQPKDLDVLTYIRDTDMYDLVESILGVHSAIEFNGGYVNPGKLRASIKEQIFGEDAPYKDNFFVRLLSESIAKRPWLFVGKGDKVQYSDDIGRKTRFLSHITDYKDGAISLKKGIRDSLSYSDITKAQRAFSELPEGLKKKLALYGSIVWGMHDLRFTEGSYMRLLDIDTRRALTQGMAREAERWLRQEVPPSEGRWIARYMYTDGRSTYVPFDQAPARIQAQLEKGFGDTPAEYKDIPVVIDTAMIRRGTDSILLGARKETVDGVETIKINPIVLRQKYRDKAWTSPEVEGVNALPEDQFQTYDEWLRFVLEHEKQHSLHPKLPNESEAEYENATNDAAIEEIAREDSAEAVVPEESEEVPDTADSPEGITDDTSDLSFSLTQMERNLTREFNPVVSSGAEMHNIFLREHRMMKSRNMRAIMDMVRLGRLIGLTSEKAYAIAYNEEGYGATSNMENIVGWDVFDPMSENPMSRVDSFTSKADAMALVKSINRDRKKPTRSQRRLANEVNMALTYAIENTNEIISSVKFNEMNEDQIKKWVNEDTTIHGDRLTSTRSLSIIFAMRRARIFGKREVPRAEIITKEKATELISRGLSLMRQDSHPDTLRVPDVSFHDKTVAEIRAEFGAEKFDKAKALGRKLLKEARKSENEYVSPWLSRFDEEWISERGGYVRHEYKIKDNVDRDYHDDYRTFFTFAESTPVKEERIYSTYEDAAIIAGLEPRTSDFTRLFEHRNNSVWKAATNKSLMSQMVLSRGYSGEPLVLPVWNVNVKETDFAHSDAAIQRPVYETAARQMIDFLNSEEIRAGRKPRWSYDVTKDPRLQLNALIKKFNPEARGYVKIADRLDTQSFKSLDAIYVKEGVPLAVMKKIVQRPIQNKAFKIVSTLNSVGKDLAISFSGFHYFSLFESWFAVFGFDKKLSNPGFNPVSKWNQMITLMRHSMNNPEMLGKWTEAGLEAQFKSPDIQTGVVDDWLDRRIHDAKKYGWTGIERGYEAIKYLREGNSKILWGTIHPGMKLHAAEHIFMEVRNNPDKYRQYNGVSDELLRQDIAQIVNNSFGGQELERTLWDNPRTRQALTLMWFAHDWTMSSANVASNLFGFDLVTGKNTTDLQKKWARQKYWPAMLAIVMFAYPNALQALIYLTAGDPDEDDKPFIWQNEVTKRAGPFGIPGVGHIDITPLVRQLPGYDSKYSGATGDRRVYMRFAKQATEVFEGWVEKPVSTFLNKQSVVIRTAWEQIFGQSTGGWDLDFAEMGISGIFTGKRKGIWGGRIAYAARKFAPMSVVQWLEGRPSTFVAPTSMGMSQYKAQEDMASILSAYAHDPAWNIVKDNPEYQANLLSLFPELLDAVERNGYDPIETFTAAKSRVLGELYSKFFNALNSGDTKKQEDLARAIIRSHGKFGGFQKSMEKKYGRARERQYDVRKQQEALEAFKTTL